MCWFVGRVPGSVRGIIFGLKIISAVSQFARRFWLIIFANSGPGKNKVTVLIPYFGVRRLFIAVRFTVFSLLFFVFFLFFVGLVSLFAIIVSGGTIACFSTVLGLVILCCLVFGMRFF